MKTLMQALIAPLLLACLAGQPVFAQTASPAVKSANLFNFATYDLGYATMSFGAYAFEGEFAEAFATLSMTDNANGTTLAFCQSRSPSVRVNPSGHTEVKFSPQVDILCPSDAAIVLTCEPGKETIISSTAYNSTYRGSGPAQVAHNTGWDMYGLRCSIVALGAEYQTSGTATLYRYLAN